MESIVEQKEKKDGKENETQMIPKTYDFKSLNCLPQVRIIHSIRNQFVGYDQVTRVPKSKKTFSKKIER